jgi:hypothetical protein
MDQTEDDGREKPMAELVEEALGRVEALLMGDHSERYTESGLAKLDELTGGGLHPGDVTAIAGQAGAGKTGLLLGIVCHAALVGGRRVAAFFPSLRPVEVVELMMLARASLSADALRKGITLTKGELRSLQETARAFSVAPMHIDPGGDEPLEEKIRRVMASSAPDVVVVDDFWPDDHMGYGLRLIKRLAVEVSASFVIGLPQADTDGDLPWPHADVVAVINRDEGGILLTLHKNRRGPLAAFLTPVPAPWKHQ